MDGFGIPIMVQWVVYDHPTDFPDKWVMRAFKVVGEKIQPTNMAWAFDTLNEIHTMIPEGCARVQRHVLDDPKIYEVWI